MTVVDASIVVRLLQNRREDGALRERFGRQRHVHAPALIDAEVASAVRGLLLTSKPAIQITVGRAEQMLDDFADLPLLRYPMQPYQRRAMSLRDNFTAYDAFYLALAESLNMPLLTDDRKYERAPARAVTIETWTLGTPPGASGTGMDVHPTWGVCSERPWVNGSTTRIAEAAFHPLARGMRGLAGALERLLAPLSSNRRPQPPGRPTGRFWAAAAHPSHHRASAS